MSQDTRALWEHLRIEEDEGIVLTAIYAKAKAAVHLQAASLLRRTNRDHLSWMAGLAPVAALQAATGRAAPRNPSGVPSLV